MRPFRSIAIDGPSGAGKSTLAKALAARLGFLYVDTGAIYRTVGLYVARQGGDCGDPQQVLPRLPELQLSLTYGADGLQHMLLAGEDVTQAIRENQVSRYASQVSAYPAVRAFLLEMQRNLARTHDVIMDGRDIGTVVLPQADLKIFLTASVEERARRRCRELQARGPRWTWRPSRRRSPSGTTRTATGPQHPFGKRRTRWWWTPPRWIGRRALRP